MPETTTIEVTESDLLTMLYAKTPGDALKEKIEEARLALADDPVYELEELAPIHTSLATIHTMTEPQRRRIATLVRDYRADTAMVYRDDFKNSNLGFTLYRGRELSSRGVMLAGLIEPDGRTHT